MLAVNVVAVRIKRKVVPKWLVSCKTLNRYGMLCIHSFIHSTLPHHWKTISRVFYSRGSDSRFFPGF